VVLVWIEKIKMEASICNVFQTLAKTTWKFLEHSRDWNYQPNEVGITDRNLVELRRKCSTHVRIYPCTQHEETQNGADWEWWITDDHIRWTGYRIQAKVINLVSNEFKQLHYSKDGIFQNDKLITSALQNSDKPRLIPLYCLFLRWSHNSNQIREYLPKYDSRAKRLYGCSLLSALRVSELQTENQKHLENVLSRLHPWHELVCPEIGNKSPNLETILEYWSEDLQWNIASEQPLFELSKPDYYHLSLPGVVDREDLPSYVQDIIDQRSLIQDRGLLGKRGISVPNDGNLAGVVVISRQLPLPNF
jgi:hypothetical protein